MGSYFIGIIVGVILTITPGPIAVVVIRQGIIAQNKKGLRIASGAAFMDVIYASVAAFASSAIIISIKDFIEKNNWIIGIIQVVCIAIMFVMGFKYLKKHRTDDDEKEAKTYIKNPKSSSAFVGGIVMSIVNIASPTFLPSLIALSGYLQSTNIIPHDALNSFLYALGFGSGVFLWLAFLLGVIRKYHSKIPIKFMSNVYKFAGYSFIIFAIILIVRIIGMEAFSAGN